MNKVRKDCFLFVVPDMYCVYMSGYASNIITSQAVLDDNAMFLQKPFSLAELSQILREALG